MRLDSLVRLIESADFSSFREIALHALAARGFAPELTDGPSDGGRDFAIYIRGAARLRHAVQVSTERDWRTKLAEDARKVRDVLGLRNLLYVSSRRIPEAEFVAAADGIDRDVGVQVERLDAQGIASLAMERDASVTILRALGIEIPVSSSDLTFSPTDHRKTLAFAVAFFGVEAEDFRRSTVDAAIVHTLALLGGAGEREAVVGRAAQMLGVDEVRRAQVVGAVDRLIQSGVVRGPNGTLRLADDALDRWRRGYGVQKSARDSLLGELRRIVAPHIRTQRAREDAALAAIEYLGALLVDESSDSARRAAFVTPTSATRERVRQLAATLTAAGVSDEAARRDVLPKMVRAAQESGFGRALMAGELYLSLTGLQTSRLVQAVTEGRPMRVLLDAPVAMPLLCACRYEPTEQRFFVTAFAVWRLLRAHRIPVMISQDYLEEIASHMLDAARTYSALVVEDVDPDLRASENAFVAHFLALRELGRAPLEGGKASFQAYLEGFECSRGLVRADFFVARDRMMDRLRYQFEGYGIKVESLQATPEKVRRAEEQVSWVLRDLNLDRSGTVVKHDARTLAWAWERGADSVEAALLCTWDRLHLHLHREDIHGLDVLEPPALSDLLALAAPPVDDLVTTSPLEIALAFTEDLARQGAMVWDRIAAIEKENLHDGTLLREAKRFKQAWMSRSRGINRARGLSDAWSDWKALHLKPEGPQE